MSRLDGIHSVLSDLAYTPSRDCRMGQLIARGALLRMPYDRHRFRMTRELFDLQCDAFREKPRYEDEEIDSHLIRERGSEVHLDKLEALLQRIVEETVLSIRFFLELGERANVHMRPRERDAADWEQVLGGQLRDALPLDTTSKERLGPDTVRLVVANGGLFYEPGIEVSVAEAFARRVEANALERLLRTLCSASAFAADVGMEVSRSVGYLRFVLPLLAKLSDEDPTRRGAELAARLDADLNQEGTLDRVERIAREHAPTGPQRTIDRPRLRELLHQLVQAVKFDEMAWYDVVEAAGRRLRGHDDRRRTAHTPVWRDRESQGLMYLLDLPDGRSSRLLEGELRMIHHRLCANYRFTAEVSTAVGVRVVPRELLNGRLPAWATAYAVLLRRAFGYRADEPGQSDDSSRTIDPRWLERVLNMGIDASSMALGSAFDVAHRARAELPYGREFLDQRKEGLKALLEGALPPAPS